MIYEQITANRRESILLCFFMILLIGAIGYVFGMYTHIGEYAVIPAVIIAILMSWGSFYYSDQIVLAMSGAHPALKEEELELYNAVEGLSIAAGIPTPRIYIIEDTAPNAFATGSDPGHAAIAVTRGLLEKMNRAELEGVIAHEMSHVRNYDIRFMALVSVLLGTIVLLSDWMTRSMWYGGRRRSRDSGSGVLMIIGLIFVILAPIIAQLMQMALSRKREYLADSSGALLTRYPEGLASALEKISQDPEPLEAANKATAHLYIANPLNDHGGWLNGLFDTHPPIADRIKRLRAM
jgi:heat shock protein HtpX